MQIKPWMIAAVFWLAHVPAYGAAGPLSADTAQLQSDTVLFQAESVANGSGDLAAFTIHADTGHIAGEKWRAAELLDARDIKMDPRTLFTSQSAASIGILFDWDHLSETQQQMLGPEGETPSGEDLLNYIAGDRSFEGTHFRVRESRLGAIVHSNPVFHDGVVYLGANDGMLHAFDAGSGRELFGYIPDLVFQNLADLADPDSPSGVFVDAIPYVRTVTTGPAGAWTALVSGLGKGGKGIFCLDVTRAGFLNADSADALSLFKWEFNDPDHLGYTTGRPLVLKTRAGYAAVFGNGIQSASGEAVIFVLTGIDTPHPLPMRLHTGARGGNGIKGDITAIDANHDGFVDFIYAGDLHGNIWKLDIRDALPERWDYAYRSSIGEPRPFFSARSPDGSPQPVTTAVDVTYHCRGDRAGYLLLFGTGDADAVHGANTVYGLWDWQQQWEIIAGSEGAGADKYFGAFARPGLEGLFNYFGDTHGLPEIRNLQLLGQRVRETRRAEGETWVIMTDHAINWWDPATGAGNHVGWYFDLPNTGEKVIHNPLFRQGTAVVMTAIPGPDGGTAALYMLDSCTGGEPVETQLDVNGDGRVTRYDTVMDSMGTARRPGGIMLDFPAASPLILSTYAYFPRPDNEGARVVGLRGKRSGATYWYIPEYDW